MRKKFVAALIAAMMATTAVSGCGTQPTEPVNVTKTAETKSETPEVVNSDAAEKYILGIADRFVLEGAKNIDLLSRKTSVDKVITDVKVDDSAVDTTKPGTYKVKYTVTVDLENLERAEAYVAEHPEALEAPSVSAQTPGAGQKQAEENAQPAADKDGFSESTENADPVVAESGAENGDAQAETPIVPSTEKTEISSSAEPVLPRIPDEVFDGSSPSTSGDPEKTAEIVIEKDVTVVTPEEAVEIIEGGGEVWTDGSNPATVEDITGEDASQTATTQPAQPVEPAVNKDKEKETTTNTDKENEHDNESSGSGGQSSQSSSGSVGGSSHTHNWVERTETVPHEETGHYETVQVGTETVVDQEAWNEPVYDGKCVCNSCGYETFSTSDMSEHVIDAHDNDASWGVVSVQVDTIHHSAVTHEEPVYEDKWVVDSEAWSEERVVGYYCTECGATK